MRDLISIALDHYGSWQNLLDMVDNKAAFYLGIPRFYGLLEDGGLRPGHMPEPRHPAYFYDAIAQRCLKSYCPEESDHSALERCMAEELHFRFGLMEQADLRSIPADGSVWEQYPLDALLRLALRLRGHKATIPFRLRTGSSGLPEDSFLLELHDGGAVTLTTLVGERSYVLDADQALDAEVFIREMEQYFRLATEERGYFVPAYVWISPDAIQA